LAAFKVFGDIRESGEFDTEKKGDKAKDESEE